MDMRKMFHPPLPPLMIIKLKYPFGNSSVALRQPSENSIRRESATITLSGQFTTGANSAGADTRSSYRGVDGLIQVS
jgi:hypothetical protein